jgi:hypothetical protein
MLLPNRFSNLKFSLVNITALVIDFLLQEEKATIKDLTMHLKNFSKDFDRDDVVLAITLLFALGKVDYSEENDLVKLAKAVN